MNYGNNKFMYENNVIVMSDRFYRYKLKPDLIFVEVSISLSNQTKFETVFLPMGRTNLNLDNNLGLLWAAIKYNSNNINDRIYNADSLNIDLNLPYKFNKLLKDRDKLSPLPPKHAIGISLVNTIKSNPKEDYVDWTILTYLKSDYFNPTYAKTIIDDIFKNHRSLILNLSKSISCMINHNDRRISDYILEKLAKLNDNLTTDILKHYFVNNNLADDKLILSLIYDNLFSDAMIKLIKIALDKISVTNDNSFLKYALNEFIERKGNVEDVFNQILENNELMNVISKNEDNEVVQIIKEFLMSIHDLNLTSNIYLSNRFYDRSYAEEKLNKIIHRSLEKYAQCLENNDIDTSRYIRNKWIYDNIISIYVNDEYYDKKVVQLFDKLLDAWEYKDIGLDLQNVYNIRTIKKYN